MEETASNPGEGKVGGKVETAGDEGEGKARGEEVPEVPPVSAAVAAEDEGESGSECRRACHGNSHEGGGAHESSGLSAHLSHCSRGG